MATVDDVRRLIGLDHGLATLSTLRADGSVQSTVVNGGLVDHPLTGQAVAAFVGRPGTRKVTHLRACPTATLVWRAGWSWVTVEGRAELLGPDDPLEGADLAVLPALLRTIYSTSGGGEHEDWRDYDRAVAAERRMAVLITPSRIYMNP
jgi:PPOX class probable F420-dependent enzyme